MFKEMLSGKVINSAETSKEGLNNAAVVGPPGPLLSVAYLI
jgi:hypothetical protein